MAYGCTITVDTGKILSSQSSFVWLATEDNFPTAAIDGGANSILNGGGNLRCYTDSTKTTQLPIEVVSFVTGGTPSVQVWGLSPTLNVGGTVYIEADAVAVAQPAVTDTYGRNAAWVDFEAVIHANEVGTDGVFVDSTGNGHSTTLTTGASLATTASSHPFGGTWPDFTTLEVLTLASSYQLVNNTAFTISCWMQADAVSGSSGLLGSRYNLPDTQWAQLQSNSKCFTKSTTVENVADGSVSVGTVNLLKLAQNSSRLDRVVNGAVGSSDTTVTDGEGINNVTVSNDFRIGTYFDNPQGRRYNGRACEFRIKRTFDNSDYNTSEYNNQSSPSTFWTTGAWEEQGGGATGTITQTTESFTQSASGNVTVAGFTGTITQTAQSFTQSLLGAIGYAGSISQTAQSFTQSAIGTALTAISGEINQSAQSFTQSAVGVSVLNITGTITQAASAFTQSAVGLVVVPISGVINQTVSSFTMSASGAIPAQWVDKLPASTTWSNQASTTTTWTDQAGVSTIWSDKV